LIKCCARLIYDINGAQHFWLTVLEFAGIKNASGVFPLAFCSG